jgi:hypothetical protein
MELTRIYSFLFHPLNEVSDTKKLLSIVNIVALSILSHGIFLIAFVFVHWCDYDINVKIKDPKVEEVILPIIEKSLTLPGTIFMINFFNPFEKRIIDYDKVDQIKKQQFEQLQQFENWADANKWSSIHDAHYDWWMFPVERPSSQYGETYAVGKGEVEELKADPIFMENYRRGVVLVVQAWGWDLEKGEAISVSDFEVSGQKWTGYGVRLAKMSDSLRLFGEKDLHQKLKLFLKQHCLTQKERVPISDLKWLMKTLVEQPFLIELKH